MKKILLLSLSLFSLSALAHESHVPHDHVSLGVIMAVALIGLCAVVYKHRK
jgi:uncharacterized GH25 family protein